jgi:hypothetical protein
MKSLYNKQQMKKNSVKQFFLLTRGWPITLPPPPPQLHGTPQKKKTLSLTAPSENSI